MTDHLCTYRQEGFCERCEARAERALDPDRLDDRDDTDLRNYTPEYGQQLTDGGY